MAMKFYEVPESAQSDEVDALLDATGAAARRAGYQTEADIKRLIAEVRAELGREVSPGKIVRASVKIHEIE